MLPIQRSLTKSIPLVQRSFASLSVEQFGALKFDAKAASPVAHADNVTVKVAVSPILVEDARAVRGVSLINNRKGLAGSTAVGKVAGSEDLVFVTDAPSWADSISVRKNHVHNLAGVSADEAAALPALLSGWAIFNQINNVKAGDSIIQVDSESAVGQAVTQIAKANGVNVINVSRKEVEDAGFVNNTKSQKNIKAAISGSSGKFLHTLLKVVPNNGQLVVYHGVYQTLENTAGVEVPISRAIFQGVRINGFDYTSWLRSNPEQFTAGLTAVTDLLKQKKVSLKVNLFDAKDFSKAVSEVESTGKLNAFKF